MKLISVNLNRLRSKLAEKINNYLALSEHNRLTIGLYKNGKCYVFGSTEENRLFYDIGSVTKTVTAHLILKLYVNKRLDINKTVDNFVL